MRASETIVGDIIEIPTNDDNHNPWEVVANPHPSLPGYIGLIPSGANINPPVPPNAPFYNLTLTKQITLVDRQETQETTFIPVTSAEYLYKILRGFNHQSLRDEDVTQFINEKIQEGYEFVSIESQPNWAAITLVKYV